MVILMASVAVTDSMRDQCCNYECEAGCGWYLRETCTTWPERANGGERSVGAFDRGHGYPRHPSPQVPCYENGGRRYSQAVAQSTKYPCVRSGLHSFGVILP